MKPNDKQIIYHGSTWLLKRFFLFLLIGALSVYGLAWTLPLTYLMDNVEKQAAAFILFAFLLVGLGLVWAWAWCSGKL